MLSTETLFGPNFSRLRSVMLPDRRADTETVRQVDTVLDPLPTLSIARPTCDIDDKLDKDRSRRWWPAGVVLLIVLGVTFAFPGMRHQWAISFVRQPTHYTALSFRNAAGLPTTSIVGAPLYLSFTVANHEGKTLTYPYVVTSASGNQAPKTIYRSAVTVPAGGQRSAHVSVVPMCQAPSCRVQVALPGHGVTIDALVTVKTPAS